MESQIDVEGGGKHLSLRRYLSELKDEPSVSTGGLRCKQLDCVRAYYYLSVLHYLQQVYSRCSQDACRPESLPTISPTATRTATEEARSSPSSADSSGKEDGGSDLQGVNNAGEGGTARVEAGSSEIQAEMGVSVSGGTGPAAGVLDVHGSPQKEGDGGSSVDSPKLATQSGESGDSEISSQAAGSKSAVSTIAAGDSCVDKTQIKPEQDSKPADSVEDSKSEQTVEGHAGKESVQAEGLQSRSNVEAGSIGLLSLSRLLQLSKGLLWDVQAKRLALTDTLGYIHRAISQHLLTDRSREVAKTLSRHPHAGGNPGHHHHHAASNVSSFAPVLADTVAAHLPADPLLNIDDVGMPTLSEMEGGASAPSVGTGNTRATVSLGSSSMFASPNVSSGASSSSSSSPSASQSPQSTERESERKARASHADPSLDSLPESNFDLDLVTMGQQWDGSRRVLWQDDPVSGSVGRGGEGRRGATDSSVHKPTSLLSPGKYINVPDEWYSLPVDEKYARSYVTLAILKDEQDFVMGELKRMSDSSQVI